MDIPSPEKYGRQQTYFSKLKPKPDLILLQETKNISKFRQFIDASCSESSAGYSIASVKEDGSKYSCVLYNKDRFEPACPKYLLNNLAVESAALANRICVVTLKCRCINRKIIVVSCHLPSKTKRKIENAELLFSTVNKLLHPKIQGVQL